MSLSIGGLQALNHSNHAYRQQALDGFYHRWQDQPLVMEKWLMLSSTSSVHSTTEKVRALMQDPVFDASNPNKLCSVLALAATNPTFFHKEDGSGYRFIAEELVDWTSAIRKLPRGWAFPYLLCQLRGAAPKTDA